MDAMRRVAVGPLDRLGVAIVMADVAADLASEIGDGGEDAAGNDVTLDLGEPELDLVEPGRVGRSEVKTDVGVMSEEVANALRLMGREVVDDDVDLATSGLASDDVAEEGDEFLGRVARRSFAEHLAALGVQSGVEGECAVAEVFESVTLGAARGERKNGIEPIERLDRGLFVDAENRRVLRRIDVEPDDVRG